MLRDEMNAYYKRESDSFPSMDIESHQGCGFHINMFDILEAWVNSTHDMMDLFYSDEENKVPFPSLKPPAQIPGSSIGEWAENRVCEYYKDRMPWPGYWAVTADQTMFFGEPEQCEMEFGNLGSNGAIVGEDYIEDLVKSFQDVQDAVLNWRSVFVSTHVIDFWLNLGISDNILYITVIKVRPCMQNKGLFTIFLFITIDACIRNEKYKLGVRNAIPYTQRLLLAYGFTKVEEIEIVKANMLLDGKEAMEKALAILKAKKAVSKLRNLYNLRSRVNATDSDEDENAVLLRATLNRFFRQRDYSDPEHVYYLDFADFPTAAELRNPEYVQAQFPKEHQTSPPRYAPGQLAGYVADTMGSSS